MRKPSVDIKIFKEHRKKLAELAQGSAVILPANPEYLRNNDVPFEYRQDTNLFYFTGFEEPGSVLVFRPGQKPESVMFVRSRDPERETWDGFRYGPEGAEKEFGLDKCFPISELEKLLPDLLLPVERVYYRMNVNYEFDKVFHTAIESARAKQGRSGLGLKPVHDPAQVVGELRLVKTGLDLEWQKRACEITADAHIAAMKFVQPGVSERQIEGVLRSHFLNSNSPRMGYSPIVASGAGATTLHYVFNDQTCRDGDLLLIDAGTEWNLYTGDVTRTFPVNGKFTSAQKRFYSYVLHVQKQILKMIRPGVLFKELQNTTIDLLTESMIELGLIKNNKEQAIERLEYKKYYPHGVSHWLGMDVHDAGAYTLHGESRPITPGMMFSVEPGLYVSVNDESAPPELRGLGVRIEDDIVVTDTGHFNMTGKCPKEIEELESIIGTK